MCAVERFPSPQIAPLTEALLKTPSPLLSEPKLLTAQRKKITYKGDESLCIPLLWLGLMFQRLQLCEGKIKRKEETAAEEDAEVW